MQTNAPRRLNAMRSVTPICLLAMTIFVASCTHGYSESVRPETSADADQCVLDHYDALPACVKGALNQWLVCTD